MGSTPAVSCHVDLVARSHHLATRLLLRLPPSIRHLRRRSSLLRRPPSLAYTLDRPQTRPPCPTFPVDAPPSRPNLSRRLLRLPRLRQGRLTSDALLPSSPCGRPSSLPASTRPRLRARSQSRKRATSLADISSRTCNASCVTPAPRTVKHSCVCLAWVRAGVSTSPSPIRDLVSRSGAGP